MLNYSFNEWRTSFFHLHFALSYLQLFLQLFRTLNMKIKLYEIHFLIFNLLVNVECVNKSQ